MIAVPMAILFLAGSIGLVIAAVVNNQLDPNLSTALGVPLANMVAMALALVGLVISALGYLRRKDSTWAQRTMACGFVIFIALALLFPLTNGGHLSSVG